MTHPQIIKISVIIKKQISFRKEYVVLALIKKEAKAADPILLVQSKAMLSDISYYERAESI